MGIIIYGTRVFTKFKGYFGKREECCICHRTYKKAYVKNTIWAHLNYLPLFPIKKVYFKFCPICGNGEHLSCKDAKHEMLDVEDTSNQNLEVYIKHIIANKPRGIFAVDNNYQLWVKDLLSNDDICVATNLTKDTIKDVRKTRDMKKIPIQDI